FLVTDQHPGIPVLHSRNAKVALKAFNDVVGIWEFRVDGTDNLIGRLKFRQPLSRAPRGEALPDSLVGFLHAAFHDVECPARDVVLEIGEFATGRERELIGFVTWSLARRKPLS